MATKYIVNNVTGQTINGQPVNGQSSGTSLYWYAENATAPETAPVATGTGSIALGDGAQALSSDMFVYGTSAGQGAENASYSNFFGYYAGNSAIDANNSNFIGNNAGYQATNADNSNFIGITAGAGATNANTSNFIGVEAGLGATGASQSNFIGQQAGDGATDAEQSNFIGFQAGQGATGASLSNFIGFLAGNGATQAYQSNFLGFQAGYQATQAYNSNFIGSSAGQGATQANNSNFFGESAGEGATEAYGSNFMGSLAGYGATGASQSNFLGTAAGYQATEANDSNFFGFQAGINSSGSSVNAFGYNAGNENIFNHVNLFGENAQANGDGQTVLSNGTVSAILDYNDITETNTYVLPDKNGTIALLSDLRPYKVYTALLNQNNGSNELVSYGNENISLGVTYNISANTDNYDLTIYGAPNNNAGTSFVSTGNYNLPYTESLILISNSGAPVATVLENTIGNIWFTYEGDGFFSIRCINLFNNNKTAILISQSVCSENYGIVHSYCVYNSNIDLYTNIFPSFTLSNNILYQTPIEIRVYPIETSFTLSSNDFITFNWGGGVIPNGTSGWTGTGTQPVGLEYYNATNFVGTKGTDIQSFFINNGLLTNNTAYIFNVTWGAGSSISSGIAMLGMNGSNSLEISAVYTGDNNWQISGQDLYVGPMAAAGTFNFPATFTLYTPIIQNNAQWC